MKFLLERDIQAAICDYLALRKVFFFRTNNIPATFVDRNGARQFRRLGKYAKKGMSDIIALKPGIAYFIEVKKDDGRLSEDQAEFGVQVTKAGHEYVVARSIEDVQRAGL